VNVILKRILDLADIRSEQRRLHDEKVYNCQKVLGCKMLVEDETFVQKLIGKTEERN